MTHAPSGDSPVGSCVRPRGPADSYPTSERVLGEFVVLHVTFALAVLLAVIAIAATGAPYF